MRRTKRPRPTPLPDPSRSDTLVRSTRTARPASAATRDAERKSILVHAPGTKSVVLREGVVAAFFLPYPIDTVVVPMQAAFQAYLDTLPPSTMRWESIGASSEEWRPVSSTTLKRCAAQLALPAARKREMTALELTSADTGGEAAEYGIEIVGDTDSTYQTLLQVYFPWSVLGDPDALCTRVRALAELLPYESGYAAPCLIGGETYEHDAMRHARAIAVRHPGFDVQANEVARWRMDGVVRNAFWLQFLGPTVLKSLGGAPSLISSLPQSCTSEPVGRGLMVRASREPEIGDVARKVDTPALRALGKLLEPVIKLDQRELAGVDFAEDRDDAWFQKWVRRFID